MQGHDWRLMLGVAVMLGGILACTTGARADKDPWVPRVFHGHAGTDLPYRMLEPLQNDGTRRLPLIIVLHGVGERGHDNCAQLRNGVRELFTPQATRERYPAFIVAPQCPDDQRWVDVDWKAPAHTMAANPTRPLAAVIDLIETLKKDLAVDPSRVYVMGISMGGFGTWEILARRPDLFAAAVPICGGADLATARSVAGIPLWVFHGRQDDVVPVERSRGMVEAIRAAGGTPRYTEYPGVGHAAWTPALSEVALLPWMFDQVRRPAKEGGTGR